MEFTVSRVDLTRSVAGVGDIIHRERSESWLVPFEAFTPAKTPQWKLYKREDTVFIPLIPYLTPSDIELAMGFMLQLGVSLALSLPSPARRLHLAIGHPMHVVTTADQTQWQTYVGFGFLLER